MSEPAPPRPLIARLEAEPERRRVTLAAETALEDGMRCEVAGRKHVVVVDEPRSVGGDDSAASPVDAFLALLAGCQAITYRMWADLLDIPLERVSIRCEGDMDMGGFFGIADVRPGFDAIRLEVTLAGPADEARYAELREMVERTCPLLDAVANGAPVTQEVVVTTRSAPG